MRILVVMTHYPFPAFVGSALVAYNSMKYLSKNHNIDLICLKPIEDDFHPTEFVKNSSLVPRNRMSQTLRNILGLLVGVPSSVSAFSSGLMKDCVKKTIERGSYDAILLFEMSAIQYCPSSSYSKLIVNIEDPLSIKLDRMRTLSVWSQWQRLKLLILSKVTDRYERKLFPKLGKILLLSISDLNDLYTQRGYKNLSYMPYGVDTTDQKNILRYEDRERAIVFSGNMYHPPNVDGILFFLNKVYPIILSIDTKATLWIVGANPDKRIYESAAKFKEKVLIKGKVESITQYIKQAAVSICPVRLKIGIQTKVLEAMSMGTPVVSTSAGNSGIGGTSGTHLWVEDEPTEFAKRVLELLNGQSWDSISSHGLNLARENFLWERSVAQLTEQIKSLP